MPSRRRAVLLAVLAVALGLYLVNAHDSPRQLFADLQQTYRDLTASDSDAVRELASRVRPPHLPHPLRARASDTLK